MMSDRQKFACGRVDRNASHRRDFSKKDGRRLWLSGIARLVRQ